MIQVTGFRTVCPNPPPASREDFSFCWLLLGPFPEFSVADGLWPSGAEEDRVTTRLTTVTSLV